METDKVFAGAIPDIYDAYLVPLIFEVFAADLARRVADAGPSAVLETAAGSGVVTRALAPRLAETAAYTVSDLNQPMLDRATRMQDPDDRITWQQADALDLPFKDRSFDAVCCQFGVMFFPDRVAGYREARRVLKPGGRFIFASDIPDYVDWTLRHLRREPELIWTAEGPRDWQAHPEAAPATRYETKTRAAGRIPAWLVYRRCSES